MNTVLYHGSDHIVRKPAYHGGKRHNDYGYGLYTTRDRDLAREWAVGADHDGYVNAYEIDTDGLSVMNLGEPPYNALNWLEILIENRTFSLRTPLAAEAARYLQENFSVPYEEADVMIGYRADDSYFRFAQDFLNGMISYEQLSRALRLGQLGEQVVIRSLRATGRLLFQGYEAVAREEWFPKKEAREQKARREYSDLDKNRYRRGDLYMIQILDEEVKTDDPRL